VAGNEMTMKIYILPFLFLTIAPFTMNAQHSDTVRRNTVKMDLTSHWLYRNAVMFSYERVNKNKPYQTWGITAGLQNFPSILGTIDSVSFKRDFKKSGYKVGGEYRFYLKKENKYGAPHGVYIGPYAALHHYSNSRGIEVNNNGQMEYADLTTQLNIFNLGVQLGYQFVINDRWTIDLVFVGPSVSHYGIKANLDGDISVNSDDITNEVVLQLLDRFPALKDFIDEGKFASKGKIDSWSFGYRYQLQVGYHFGRKKK